MFGRRRAIRDTLRGSDPRPADATSASPRPPHTSRCRLAANPTVAAMDPLRHSGEWLESAMGLPHSPRHGSTAPSAAAAGKAAAGTPDWAAPNVHYPGEGAKAGVYPDDSAPTAAAKAATSGTASGPKFDLAKMSPRAKAITEEVGRELEESPSIIG
ncbi:hypothetical protein C2E21_6671 [Chlorella sorokiniana]|uniref:Uncharacterized protein n=1 Tax=Chlorella sorokiniana TaxID=3076 RepID=A0A2P6TKI7_CHLSO|nr:hypothetical protein C2E21_6671 [Chlorella sorokiniana]|eukprot:PRW44602.1 hypothetical protein C2E21_6671 [Chlorella sorokiniana]